MPARSQSARRHAWLAVGLLFLFCSQSSLIASPPGAAGQAPAGPAAPRWPCRLIIADDLRASVELAWERSPTFRSQCERLAAARTLVLLHRASSAQISRQAQSTIGVSGDGVTIARVLVRVNADTIELIAHELEHILERLDGVNLAERASRHRSSVTLYGDAYETDRAIDAGRRVAREVRETPHDARK
jgi:hypothetical protein